MFVSPVYWMDFALKDGTLRTDADSGFARLDWLLEVQMKTVYMYLSTFTARPGELLGSCDSQHNNPTELYAGDPDTVEWNQSVVLNIWSALATRYKDNPTVAAAYGLLNEPVLNFDTNPAYENLKYGFMTKSTTLIDRGQFYHISRCLYLPNVVNGVMSLAEMEHDVQNRGRPVPHRYQRALDDRQIHRHHPRRRAAAAGTDQLLSML